MASAALLLRKVLEGETEKWVKLRRVLSFALLPLNSSLFGLLVGESKRFKQFKPPEKGMSRKREDEILNF